MCISYLEIYFPFSNLQMDMFYLTKFDVPSLMTKCWRIEILRILAAIKYPSFILHSDYR